MTNESTEKLRRRVMLSTPTIEGDTRSTCSLQRAEFHILVAFWINSVQIVSQRCLPFVKLPNDLFLFFQESSKFPQNHQTVLSITLEVYSRRGPVSFVTNSAICYEYGLETGANSWQIRQRFGTNAAARVFFLIQRTNTEAPKKKKKKRKEKNSKQ